MCKKLCTGTLLIIDKHTPPKRMKCGNTGACCIALYITPPQRTWAGLTDEGRIEIDHLALSRVQAVQMTEAKLKELNT
jgi:hypothetical protein